jgi:hypothetical protein
VIALQTPPHVASLNANYRILAGGVVRVSAEDVHPNEALLQQVAVTANLLIDNILEKLFAAFAGSKMPAGYDSVKLLSNEIRLNRVVLRARRGWVISMIEWSFFEHAEIIRCSRYGAKALKDQLKQGVRALLTVRALCHTLLRF